ncbi:hypothetical protein NDU88_000956 [Pleurodeles waltl]|uniref:Uncharacterized protein n=1 Tax=Pleurodeles waltl TaxID=8319 RepID=A0AAV7VAH2_PLEWA|nr:hypothetical protein NDU88_000956 [Pleurodeles waltl]
MAQARPRHHVGPPGDALLRWCIMSGTCELSEQRGERSYSLAQLTSDAKVAHYMVGKICQTLENEVKVRLRAEFPRAALSGKVAATPEINPNMCTFFGKYMCDPKKGIGFPGERKGQIAGCYTEIR